MQIALIVAAVAVVAALVAAYYFYFRRSSKKDAEPAERPTAQIIFFYAQWCPHCKKARPEWDKFSAKWNKQSLGGVTVVVSDVDCDADEPTANKYDITGYPTVKCILNQKIAEFDGAVEADALELFLRTCIES
jgi:thiol-disulfide isomerase/thioredoxin